MFGFNPAMMGKPRKPPFSLSGTFASGLDGWTATNASRTTSNVRTSPGAVDISSGGYLDYFVDKEVCGGLTISVSIWARNKAGGGAVTTKAVLYKIGSGSFIPLASATDTSGVYAELSGSFDNLEEDVTIRVSSSDNAGLFDDWSISGA